MHWWLLTGCLTLAACKREPGTAQPIDGDQCLGCHVGIETAHEPIDAGYCTSCHGGDATASTLEAAHVLPPANWAEIRGTGLPAAPHGYIKDFSPNQLDALDEAYLRFINPGDIRVADEACGDCHPTEVAGILNSVMTTNTGHYWPTRYYNDQQGPWAEYGSYPASDPDCDPELEDAVCSLAPLNPAAVEDLEAAIASGDEEALAGMAYDHYLAKSCNHCHAAGYGANDSPYTYRSTGCSSCHVIYNKDGVYEGNDQAIPPGVPVYPKRHEITSAIPTEQCATCHFQGGRIGLNFRGIREGGFPDAPPHAQPWNESAYGHVSGYYFLDEDTTNDIDETPPDVHYERGMHCVDCHVGTEVHGDGRIYSSSKGQLDISCEDCHGDARSPAQPNDNGHFYTATGRLLDQLSMSDQGRVILTGRVDGVEHTVPQPASILASNWASDEMHQAMGENEAGWSHTDSLTCDSCHNSWQLYCIGCHVSVDLRLEQVDRQTGTSSPGLVRGTRDTWSLDGLLLSQRPDGRIQATIPSQHVQLELYDRSGTQCIGDTDADGEALGIFRTNEITTSQAGFAPFFQHTSSKTPRDCSACHRTDESEAENTRVKGVYGFGTGEFLLANPAGDPVDPLRFLDENGEQISAFAHPGSGPLSPEQLERALGVILSSQETTP